MPVLLLPRHTASVRDDRYRRILVVAARSGEGPFTIPLRSLLIVCCQPVVFESTTYVPGTPLELARFAVLVPLPRLSVMDVRPLEMDEISPASACNDASGDDRSHTRGC